MMYLDILMVLIVFGTFTGALNAKLELSKGICDTSCSNGFIRTSDLCSFTCTVTLDAKPKIGTSVRFQIIQNSLTSIDDLEHFELSGECFENYNTIYQCTKVKENVYNISYAVNAFNKEKVRCRMKNTISNEAGFPKLYDPTEATGELYINGLKMLNDNYCNTTIEKNDFFLEFDCLSSAEPCVVEIYVNNSVVVYERKNHVFFNGTCTSEANVSLKVKYASCRLDGTHKVLHCRIHSKFIQVYDRIKSDNLPQILLPVAALVLIIIVLIFVIRLKCRKMNERKLRQKNGDNSQLPSPGKEQGREIHLNNIGIYKKNRKSTDIKEDDVKESDIVYKDELDGTQVIVSQNDSNGPRSDFDCQPEYDMNGKKIESRDEKGRTPLIIAATIGDTDNVNRLITQRSDLEAVTKKGQTALMFAAKNGHAKIVTCLIKHKANLEKKDIHGRTVLMLAAKYKKSDVVKILLENKANVHEKDEHDRTALMFASLCGDDRICDMLLKENANVNDRSIVDKTCLMYASRNGHTETVKLLIARDADVNATNQAGKTALIYAADYSYMQTFEELFEHDADVNAKKNYGRTAIELAPEHRKIETAKFKGDTNKILEKTKFLMNESISSESKSTLKGNEDSKPLLPEIKETEKKVDKVGLTHLKRKSFQFDESVQNGADLKTENNRTSLIEAVRKRNNEVVKILLQSNADVHRKDMYGWNALMYASLNGQDDICGMLLNNEANVNDISKDGKTCLMYASRNGHTETVTLLITKGADVNAKDQGGKTALMRAADYGDMHIINELLKHNAEADAKDNDGWTPVTYAQQRGHTELAELIKTYIKKNSKYRK